MKVTFCAYDGKNIINGINSWHLRILPALVRLGYDINVIFVAWADEMDCTIIPLLKSAGINCFLIPKPHYSEDMILWILKHINETKPDILVANQMPQALYASKWLTPANIPTICVLHNDDDEYSAIVKEFLLQSNCYTPKVAVAVSDSLNKKLNESKHFLKIEKIPCGAPIPNSYATYSFEKFRLIYVGRIVQKQKNILSVTKAFCEVISKIPGTEACIYGSGIDLNLVEKTLTDFGNPKNVRLKGNLSPAEIELQLMESQVFVLMSDFEGIPVAMMEAMAFGVVPICKKIDSGIPELLIDGVTGFYVESIADILNKVTYLKNNPSIWQEISNNARILIKEKYSSSTNLTKWDTLLKNTKPYISSINIVIPKKIILPKKNLNLIEDIRRGSCILRLKKGLISIYSLLRNLRND